jgi:hypothetical protein
MMLVPLQATVALVGDVARSSPDAMKLGILRATFSQGSVLG